MATRLSLEDPWFSVPVSQQVWLYRYVNCYILKKRAIRFTVLADIVGWVKRDLGTIFVGFAYLNVPQQSELASKLANPTRSAADHRLNPTYDLSFWPTKWISPKKFKNPCPASMLE